MPFFVRRKDTRVFVFVQDYTDLDDSPDFYFYDFGRCKDPGNLPKSFKSKKTKT
jgi:hypothetical protein